MKVAGIVAEFNPLHTGHEYIINEARRLTGCDYVMVIMSGNFVQRGEPALADKFTRTRMALACGADIVIELPSLSASAAAADFAYTAVSVLLHTGVLTHLVFGSESGQIKLLSSIADILTDEPMSFKEALRVNQKNGMTFPAARSQALKKYLSKTSTNHIELETSDFLNTPNDILAVEYLIALKKLSLATNLNNHIPVTPVTISRAGAGYHDTSMQQSFISATALRQWFLTYSNQLPDTGIPSSCLDIYQNWLTQHLCVYPNDLTELLGLTLLQTPDYDHFLGISTDLSHRISKYRHTITSFEHFADTVKSKNMTRSAISRALLHIILNQTKADMDLLKNIDCAPYIRLLGLNKRSSKLLKAIQNHSDIPVITKPADAKRYLNQTQLSLFQKDLYTARVYRILQIARQQKNNHVSIPDELQQSPVIITSNHV